MHQSEINIQVTKATSKNFSWLAGFKHSKIILALVVLSDILAIIFSFILFYLIRVHGGIYSDITGYPIWLFPFTLLLIVLFWMLVFWFFGVYTSVHNRSLFDEYYTVTKVIAIVCILFLGFVYIEPSVSGYPSKSFVSVLIYFITTSGFIGFSRWSSRSILKALRKNGIGQRNTIVIGESARSLQLLNMFAKTPELGYSVVGTIQITGNESKNFISQSVGYIKDIDKILTEKNVEVSVLGMENDRELVLKLLTESKITEKVVKIIPDLYEIINGQTKAQHLYGVPLIEINPELMPAWQKHSKRILDVLFSCFALIVSVPVMAVTAICIKLDDSGPVFYHQERVGLNGKKFYCHKFRSMSIDAESNGISWTKVNDPRVTKIGKIIRSTHIDELPQFWNVLRGEMSIVGPRPERAYYVEKHTKLLPAYPRRLRVKPGLTGWNQVHVEEYVENVNFVREKLRQDFFYIENISLRLDIEIIFRTILRVIGRKGQT